MQHSVAVPASVKRQEDTEGEATLKTFRSPTLRDSKAAMGRSHDVADFTHTVSIQLQSTVGDFSTWFP